MEIAALIVSISVGLFGVGTWLYEHNGRKKDKIKLESFAASMELIRVSAQDATRLAGEALAEAKKAHEQRSEQTSIQRTQLLREKMDSTDKNICELAYELDRVVTGNSRFASLIVKVTNATKAAREAVHGIRSLRKRFDANSVALEDVEKEFAVLANHFDELSKLRELLR